MTSAISIDANERRGDAAVVFVRWTSRCTLLLLLLVPLLQYVHLRLDHEERRAQRVAACFGDRMAPSPAAIDAVDCATCAALSQPAPNVDFTPWLAQLLDESPPQFAPPSPQLDLRAPPPMEMAAPRAPPLA